MSDYNLITKGLHEIIGGDVLQKIAATRAVKVYFGTCPTGRIHLAYYIPLLKIAELVQAGCKVTILIADLHAILDNLKSTEKQVHNRIDYYIRAIKAMLQVLKVDLDQIRFVTGSEFQLQKDYTMDMYRLHTMISVRDAQHAGAQVVKQTANPMMTGLMYPTLQALDEQYLDVDAQLGGVDQRKIFTFAQEILPKIGYRKRAHLMTPMVPGLRCKKTEEKLETETVEEDDGEIEIKNKMSASDEKTKLDMLDTRGAIKKKLAAAYCLPGDVTDNSVLDILEKVLFPLLTHIGKHFEIFRREEHGGPIVFESPAQVRDAYATETLHPADFKEGVIHTIDMFIEPVRKEFESREWRQTLKHAYD